MIALNQCPTRYNPGPEPYFKFILCLHYPANINVDANPIDDFSLPVENRIRRRRENPAREVALFFIRYRLILLNCIFIYG